MKREKALNEDLNQEGADIPNETTLAALLETDRKIRYGSVGRFSGSTKDFLKEILNEQDQRLINGFIFQVKPTYSGETLTSLEHILTAMDSVITGSTDGANKDTGEILITMGDNKRIAILLTGQAGVGAMFGLDAGVFSASVVAYKRKSKK